MIINKLCFSCSYKLQVQRGDYVIAKGDKSGKICYIGHLDNTPDVLYVGLELAQPGIFFLYSLII